MRGRGWVSMGSLAISSAYTPGSPDDTAFVDAVLRPLLGAPDHIDAGEYRLPFFELCTLAVAELRRTVEAPEGQAPRRMPAIARNARMGALARRLPGLQMSGERERSHKLVDVANDPLGRRRSGTSTGRSA